MVEDDAAVGYSVQDCIRDIAVLNAEAPRKHPNFARQELVSRFASKQGLQCGRVLAARARSLSLASTILLARLKL
jgi:hypothetical protein